MERKSIRYGGKAAAICTLQAISIALALAFMPLRWLRRALRPGFVRPLWTGSPIITLAVKARAERLLGVDARSLAIHTYYVTKAFDHDWSRWRAMPFLRPLVPFAAFVWISLWFDRIHCFCDRGVLPSTRPHTPNFLELRFYRVIGMEVYLYAYGADVRRRTLTVALGEPNCCTDCNLVGEACICDQVQGLANLERLRTIATAIFSMGDMVEYTPGSINDLFYWPVGLGADDGRRYAPSYPVPDPSRLVRIVHAPNHRSFKGTRFLEGAVRALREEGLPVELVPVEKVPNEQALELYRSADVIFDQCLVGFHGYFALEGMALGKPVMTFIRKPSQYLLHLEECPLINTHVLTLKEDIRRLVANREALADAGRRGRAYVEKHFSLQAFSDRLRQAYQGMGIKA